MALIIDRLTRYNKAVQEEHGRSKMKEAISGERASELSKEELTKRLKNGTAYLDVILKGQWEYKKTGVSTYTLSCSECGNIVQRGEGYASLAEFKEMIQTLLEEKYWRLDNFCHECGADMR